MKALPGSSSIECEPKAEPGIKGAARRDENLRAELVKACLLLSPAFP